MAGYGENFWANENDEPCSLSKVELINLGDNNYTMLPSCIIEQDTLFDIDVIKKDSIFLISGRDYFYKYHVSAEDSIPTLLKYELTADQYIIDAQQYLQDTYVLIKEQGNFTMLVLDEQLNYQSEILVDLPQLLIIEAFYIKDDTVLLIGKDKSAHTQYSDFYDDHSSSSIFFKAYNLDTILTDDENLDIEISAISSDNPYVINSFCQQEDLSCGTPVVMFYENIQVEITNNSPVPIHSFHLNARYDNCRECQHFCGVTQVFSQTYSNLNIAPGASRTVTFNNMEIRNIPYTAQHDLCIWTSVPNQKIDTRKSNDLACSTFEVDDSQLTTIVMETTKPLAFDLRHTPLMADSQLWIYDTQGRMLHKITPLEHSFFYDYSVIKNLPVGIYFVQIRADEDWQYASFFKS